MIRISATQVQAFDAIALDGFERNLAAFLREEFGPQLTHMSDEELHVYAARQVEVARIAGLEAERDIALFAAATVALAPHFPDAMPGLLDIIANDALPYEDRAEALAQAAEGGA